MKIQQINRRGEQVVKEIPVVKIMALTLVSIVLIIALFIGGLSGCKAWERGQHRADARNHVQITRIEIQKANEQAKIVHAEVRATQAEREKRVVEAKGLAEAQKLIDYTLTPLYIQHEAIQAQERIATSGKNNTVIYVPAGTNGTPVITQAGRP